MNVICIFLAFAAVALSAADNYCPAKQIGSSCTCSHDIRTTVLCKDINDPQELFREIQIFRGYKIDFLHLANLKLPYLPPGLFSGTSVKQLVLINCVLDNLYSTNEPSPSPFAGLEDSLTELAIYSTSNPSKWYWTALKDLKKLKSIELVQSQLDFVGHVFAEIGKGSLEKITVAYSEVNRIHPQGFPELVNLKEVNFAGNNIPYMVRTMFADPAPHLRKIDLSANKLFTLPENMFDNMPALEFLDLSQNDFKSFIDMPAYNSLGQFYISNNPFECGCHLLQLKQKLLSSSLKHTDIDEVICILPTVPTRHLLVKNISDDDFNC